MKHLLQRQLRSIIVAGLCLPLVFSCSKVDVALDDNRIEDDPNVSIYEDYPVELSTFQNDSFLTTGDSSFTIGYHKDPVFGTITGTSYTEVDLPYNDIKDKSVLFDSLVLLLRPNGNVYGDSLLPFKMTVHRLLEPIENEDASNTSFYNPRSFAFETQPVGQYASFIRPNNSKTISIRMSDAMGMDLLSKLKNDDDSIQTNDRFHQYLKGLCIQADSSVSNSLYYFHSDSGRLMRLYYTLQGVFPEKKYVDFSFNGQKQFNSIRHHGGASLATFTPYKKQLKESSLTGNKVFLNTNMGYLIKLRFPSLLKLKETAPYVKVLKAELIVKPSAASWQYPYQLPKNLFLYTTDDGNEPGTALSDINGYTQTGNLTIDQLYGVKTFYTYDVTAFVNTVINEGVFSQLALMLVAPSWVSDASIDRLVLDDQSLNKNVQLKLYVLGL